jgi:hypothetical protein
MIGFGYAHEDGQWLPVTCRGGDADTATRPAGTGLDARR